MKVFSLYNLFTDLQFVEQPEQVEVIVPNNEIAWIDVRYHIVLIFKFAEGGSDSIDSSQRTNMQFANRRKVVEVQIADSLVRSLFPPNTERQFDKVPE